MPSLRRFRRRRPPYRLTRLRREGPLMWPPLAGLALLAPLWAACNFVENPDEVQNSTNNAFLEAQVFASRDDRTPVEGVIMIVESDPDSERPFQGPDQSFLSDRNGFIRAEVFPGADLGQQQGTGGPQTPLDVPPPLFFGDACVHFIHDGLFSTFSCGVTLGAGKVLKIGSFFANEFTSTSGSGSQ